VGVGFVVAGQAAVVHEPAEGAFDDPAAGLDVEAAGGGVALDDFEVDAETTDLPGQTVEPVGRLSMGDWGCRMDRRDCGPQAASRKG
jgi:hypothetical protein